MQERTGMTAPAIYRIFVRDFEIDCHIGVNEHEQGRAQRVRFNVELEAREAEVPRPDSIAQVYDYGRITAHIRAPALEGHVNLSETLAERLALLCLADARIVAARVRVEKLEVEPSAAGVGVEIERRRA